MSLNFNHFTRIGLELIVPSQFSQDHCGTIQNECLSFQFIPETFLELLVLFSYFFFSWRRKWQPTLVLLPGKNPQFFLPYSQTPDT